MAEKFNLIIGGEWVKSGNGQYFDDFNPATGNVFARVAMGTRDDAKRAVEAAVEAQKSWALQPSRLRAAVITKTADILEAELDNIVQILIDESGSSYGKAQFETRYTAGLLRAAAESCFLATGETFPSETDKLCMTIRQPAGIVAAISPWNFPLLLSMNKVAYALALGNAVILKPSSETPVIGLKIGELFMKAGLPAGLLNVVPGPGGIVGDELIAHPEVRVVSFTGETATGRKVAESAGRGLKKVGLELGGKDPVIVLRDADLEYAVDAVAFGAFFHQGQICMSVERVIVEEEIAEEFARRLAEKVMKLPVGDPRDPATVIGPLINREQLELVDAHVSDARSRGAKLLCGGKIDRLWYYPAVISGVTPEMRIFKEETFGPVAPITAARTLDEAVELANQVDYGLSAGVITRDLQNAVAIAEKIKSGMIHLNDASVYDEPYAPFGGVKSSGIGREGGKESVNLFTELKWVTVQRGKRQFPF